MKTLIAFLSKNPSYFKRGSESLAMRTKLATSTIVRFKNSLTYNEMKKEYLNSL